MKKTTHSKKRTPLKSIPANTLIGLKAPKLIRPKKGQSQRLDLNSLYEAREIMKALSVKQLFKSKLSLHKKASTSDMNTSLDESREMNTSLDKSKDTQAMNTSLDDAMETSLDQSIDPTNQPDRVDDLTAFINDFSL